MATLADIRTKVRRLTRSPSNSQLTDAQIDDYVNNFLLYDFPEQLRLKCFRRTLSFYTTPYVDVYDTNTLNATDPLYDFKNVYLTSEDPVFIAGYKAYFTQSRSDFFTIYPKLQASFQVGTGDGANTYFAGTLPYHPVLMREVLFSSVDAFGKAVMIIDSPNIDGTGTTTLAGDLIIPNNPLIMGTIGYNTGVYTFDFAAAPANGAVVNAQIVQYQASRPQAMLFYNNKFTLRPVPDNAYKVDMEVYIRPIALINAGDEPELEQHFQFIALSAAKKILIDRLDMETVALIEPECKHQELLCLRRTLVQQSNERVATIFTMQTSLGASGWNWDNFG